MTVVIVRRTFVGALCTLATILPSSVATGQILNESAKLLASDGAAGDRFGTAVSISGDVAVVGAYADDDNGSDSGSAYVFRWNGSSWAEEQKLLAPDGMAGDGFGFSVSVSGSVVVVGAISDACAAGTSCGSAHAYRFNGSTWAWEQKLTPSDAGAGHNFGVAVSVDGNVAVVGAYLHDMAYVYHWEKNEWVEKGKLTDPGTPGLNQFGRNVSVSGNVVIVGAHGDDETGVDSGAAHVYRWNGTSWAHEQKLTVSDAEGGVFGFSVSIIGDVAVAGAYGDDDNGDGSGSAYLFRRNGSNWAQEQKVLASDGASPDNFGISASVSGNAAVVGAYVDDCAVGADCGSVYVYHFNGSIWGDEQKLVASDGAAGDQFGISVSVSGNMALVGAWLHDGKGTDTGAAYAFAVGGTCCIPSGSCEAEGNCQENITPSACQALSGRFFGPNVTCAQVCVHGACIPTVSRWGVIVLSLLIAGAGSAAIRRWRIASR